MRIFPSFRFFRYFLFETIPYVLLTLLVLTLLILAQQVSRQSELLFSSAASALLSLRIILSLLPGILVITLPFSLLIGSLMALNRISADNEIIAARSCGINKSQISLAFLSLAFTGTLLSGYLTLKIIPKLYTQAKNFRTELITRVLTTPIKPQTFNTQFANHLLYVRDLDKITGDWLGVFIIRQLEGNETLVLTAQRGSIRITQSSPYALEIALSNGILLTYNQASPEKQTLTSFEHQQIRLSTENPLIAQVIEKERSHQELTLPQLSIRSTAPNATVQERRQAKVEWHKRLALPLACIILVALALPLGLSSLRQIGRAVAFALGFLIALIYYLLLIAGQNFALSGALPPWAGIWLPNLLGFACSLCKFPAWQFHTRKNLSHKNSADKTSLNLEKKEGNIHAFLSSRSPLFLGLTNYLLITELAKVFFIALSILVLTSLIFTLFDLLPSLSRSGLGTGYAITYLLYLSPQIIYYVGPFALLLATLTAHGILSRSNQITALLTSGVRVSRLFMPLGLSTIMLMTGLYWLSESVLPITNREQDARFNRIKGKKLEQAVLAMGQYWVEGEDKTIYGYQQPLQSLNNRLLNTNIYKLSNTDSTLQSLLFVHESRPQTDTSWHVTSGWSYKITKSKGLIFRPVTPDQSVSLTVPEGASLFQRIVNEAAKMSFQELRTYIRYLQRLGIPTSSLRVDLEKKLAFPFACVPLLTLACAIALKGNRNRAGTLAGIASSIIIGLTFWIGSSFFEGLGRQAYLPPGLSVWGPQALFLFLGIFLAFRLRK